MGRERYMKGSKVMETLGQVGQVIVLLSCPWNRSTMSDWFRSLCASQCSSATTRSSRPFESLIST
jgi:hypothetical protein